MADLNGRLRRLEHHTTGPPPVHVWLQDPEDAGTLVCAQTGERVMREEFERLPRREVTLTIDRWTPEGEQAWD